VVPLLAIYFGRAIVLKADGRADRESKSKKEKCGCSNSGYPNSRKIK
jgi:hypothetical protein